MRSAHRLAFGVAALAWFCGNTAAQHASGDASTTGMELLTECRQLVALLDEEKDVNLNEAARCAGYIQGIHELTRLYQATKLPTLYCPPDTVTMGQVARIVEKYLRDHPAKLHEPGSILVTDAAKEAFPCKEGH